MTYIPGETAAERKRREVREKLDLILEQLKKNSKNSQTNISLNTEKISENPCSLPISNFKNNYSRSMEERQRIVAEKRAMGDARRQRMVDERKSEKERRLSIKDSEEKRKAEQQLSIEAISVKFRKFTNKFFTSNEVKIILNILDSTQYDFNCHGFSSVKMIIANNLKSNQELSGDILRFFRSPKDLTYYLIITTCMSLIETGNYHLYRGVINPLGIGNDLVRMAVISAKILVERESVDEDFYNIIGASIINAVETSG